MSGTNHVFQEFEGGTRPSWLWMDGKSSQKEVFWAKGAGETVCQEQRAHKSHKEIKAGKDLGRYPVDVAMKYKAGCHHPQFFTCGK